MDFLNTDEKKNRRLVHLPMGRFGEAIEIAKGALFRESPTSVRCGVLMHATIRPVASDDSSYMTVRARFALASRFVR